MNAFPAVIAAMVTRINASTNDHQMRRTSERLVHLVGGTQKSCPRPVTIGPSYAALLAENAFLKDEVARLQAKLSNVVPEMVADGFFSMNQFLTKLTATLRRSYGWRTDYVSASHTTAGCRSVTNEDIHRWQVDDRVPEWGYDQIDRLVFHKRTRNSRPAWSQQEIQHLITLITTQPTLTNSGVATTLSAQFGRPISEASAKAKKDRLRKEGRLPAGV